MCKRHPDGGDGEVHLSGLFPGKGQRVDDLMIENPTLTRNQIVARLETLKATEAVTSYTLGGQEFFMLEI